MNDTQYAGVTFPFNDVVFGNHSNEFVTKVIVLFNLPVLAMVAEPVSVDGLLNDKSYFNTD